MNVKFIFKVLLLSLLFTFNTVNLFAQTTEEIIFLEIPEVITASRVLQKITEAPSVISIITEEDIKKYGAKTLGDILKILPGLTFRKAGTKLMVNPRGMFSTASNSVVLFMLDGRPLNNQLQGEFYINYKFPIHYVKRIEVIKGPGSALYGANAFTGVVNIITKDADDINESGLNAGWGSDSTRYFDMAVKFEDREKAASGVIFLYDYNTEGQQLVNDNEEVKVKDFYAKYQKSNITLSAGSNKVFEGIAGPLSLPNPDDVREIDTSFVDFLYNKDINPNTNFKFRGYANYQEEFSTGLLMKNSTFGSDTQFTFSKSESNTLVAGFDVRDTRAEFEGIGAFKANILAVYLQDEMKMGENLSITLGGRFDSHSIYDDVFSPRVGAVYQASDSMTFKLSYGEAFKAPSFTELYFDVWPYGVNTGIHIIPDEDLKPEKIKTVEAGIEKRYSNKLIFNVTGFYNDAKDAIALNAVPNPPIGPPQWIDLFTVNRDKVTSSGVETEIKGGVTKRF
jgi:outer membrane receptor for ferrienterochelin and colicin